MGNSSSAFKDVHVVIVGGGYGGSLLARKLDPSVRVTVVERRDTVSHRGPARQASVGFEFVVEVFVTLASRTCHFPLKIRH